MKLQNLSSPEQEGAMLWLWKHMLARFGTTWTREYGEADGEAATIWRDALGGLTGEQLKRGVDSCQAWDNSFPPNMAQFSKMCLTSHDNPPEVQKYLNPPSVTKPSEDGFARIRKEHKAVERMSTARDADFVGAWDYLHHHTQFPLGRLDPEKRREYMENSK